MPTDPKFFAAKIFPQIMMNKPIIDTSCRHSKVDRIWSGSPAVIVGSGPSLDQHMDFLKGKKVISTDMSVLSLHEAGIKVDAVVSAEIQELGYQYLKLAQDRGFDFSETLMYLSAAAYPGTASLGAKQKVFFGDTSWRKMYPPLKDNRIHFSDKECIVGYTAFRLGHLLGANPLYLVGMDLCFDKARYAKNTWHALVDKKSRKDILSRVDKKNAAGTNKPIETKRRSGAKTTSVVPYIQGAEAIKWFSKSFRMGKKTYDLSDGILPFPPPPELSDV